MGYAVYEHIDQCRWAGYGVPAECDHPQCATTIDRGMGYRCESHGYYDDHDEWTDDDGCGRFFCSDHENFALGHHTGREDPKPDSTQWLTHMLTDESWQQWRDLKPQRVEDIVKDLATRSDSDR